MRPTGTRTIGLSLSAAAGEAAGMTADKEHEARRKRLRRSLPDGSTEVAIGSDDLRWLLDEVSRLQQSNDRLRRQNRRLRLRRDSEPVAPGDDAEA